MSDECDCTIETITTSAYGITPSTNFNATSDTFSTGHINPNVTDCGPSESDDPVDLFNGKSVYFKGINQGATNTIYHYKITCLEKCWIKSIKIDGGCGWENSTLQLWSYQLGNRRMSISIGDDSSNDYLSGPIIIDMESLGYGEGGKYGWYNEYRLIETNSDLYGRYRGSITLETQTYSSFPNTTDYWNCPSNGFMNLYCDICCPLSCVVCGGNYCSSNRNCCHGVVKPSNQKCSDTGSAPCVTDRSCIITPSPTQSYDYLSSYISSN